MAEEDADVGSISDSVIFVRVISLLAGRKFLTPEIRFSKFAPRAPSRRRSVRRLEMEEKPRKSSLLVEEVGGGCVGAEVIIVMRVISRTLRRTWKYCQWDDGRREKGNLNDLYIGLTFSRRRGG